MRSTIFYKMRPIAFFPFKGNHKGKNKGKLLIGDLQQDALLRTVPLHGLINGPLNEAVDGLALGGGVGLYRIL